MKIIISTVILIFTSSIIFGQETEKLKADVSLSNVTYAMSHPLHDWEGVNKNVKSVIVRDKKSKKINKVAVALILAQFNSGNANRDSHAVEILEGIKYPTVTFVSNSIQYGKEQIEVKGILNFHDVKKEITFSVLHKRLKGYEAYSGNFTVDMTEYNVKPPSLMSMPTDKNIKISFFLVF